MSNLIVLITEGAVGHAAEYVSMKCTPCLAMGTELGSAGLTLRAELLFSTSTRNLSYDDFHLAAHQEAQMLQLPT